MRDFFERGGKENDQKKRMFAKRGQKNFVEIDGYCWNKKQTTGISVRQTNPGHLGERGGRKKGVKERG